MLNIEKQKIHGFETGETEINGCRAIFLEKLKTNQRQLNFYIISKANILPLYKIVSVLNNKNQSEE